MLPKKRKSCPWEHGSDSDRRNRLQDDGSGVTVVLGNLCNTCRFLGRFATSPGREWAYCRATNFRFVLPRTVHVKMQGHGGQLIDTCHVPLIIDHSVMHLCDTVSSGQHSVLLIENPSV
jgi:hypothetical protein